MEGKIVLVQRGECPFLEKALRGQKHGARGVIIGDPNNDVLFRMNYAPNASVDAASLLIPCVSVTWPSFRLIALAVGDPSATVSLNYQGDYTSSINNEQGDVLRFAGVLLLSLPCLWCVAAAGYVLFKKFTYRRERLMRLARAADLPIVAYRRTSESMSHVADANMSDKVHNDSCAICLDEFHAEEPIALLPCCHGFHRHCLDPWLDRSALCPICKQSILDLPAVMSVAVDDGVGDSEPGSIAMVPLTSTPASVSSASTAPLLAFQDSAGPPAGAQTSSNSRQEEHDGGFTAL